MTTLITLNTSDALEPYSRVTINSNFAALNAGKAEVTGQVFTGPISATNLSGTNTGDQTLNSLLPAQGGNSGKVLITDGTNASWGNPASSNGGTVTLVSVAAGNGFSGSVANSSSTPAISLSVSVSGVLKGSSGALVQATAGTDYISPTGTETMSNKTIVNPVINATNPTAQTYTPTAGGTASLDLSLSNMHFVTFPSGNITLGVSNGSNNKVFLVTHKKHATGSRTVTWFSGISWASGVAPTLTTTGNKTDVFIFIRTGVGAYLGFTVDKNL